MVGVKFCGERVPSSAASLLHFVCGKGAQLGGGECDSTCSSVFDVYSRAAEGCLSFCERFAVEGVSVGSSDVPLMPK